MNLCNDIAIDAEYLSKQALHQGLPLVPHHLDDTVAWSNSLVECVCLCVQCCCGFISMREKYCVYFPNHTLHLNGKRSKQ